MAHNSPVTFDDVECIRETDLAILAVIEGEEHWIPKSVLHEDSEVECQDDIGCLAIQEWWADEKGLT